jgi:hypothetical protein
MIGAYLAASGSLGRPEQRFIFREAGPFANAHLRIRSGIRFLEKFPTDPRVGDKVVGKVVGTLRVPW